MRACQRSAAACCTWADGGVRLRRALCTWPRVRGRLWRGPAWSHVGQHAWRRSCVSRSSAAGGGGGAAELAREVAGRAAAASGNSRCYRACCKRDGAPAIGDSSGH